MACENVELTGLGLGQDAKDERKEEDMSAWEDGTKSGILKMKALFQKKINSALTRPLQDHVQTSMRDKAAGARLGRFCAPSYLPPPTASSSPTFFVTHRQPMEVPSLVLRVPWSRSPRPPSPNYPSPLISLPTEGKTTGCPGTGAALSPISSVFHFPGAFLNPETRHCADWRGAPGFREPRRPRPRRALRPFRRDSAALAVNDPKAAPHLRLPAPAPVRPLAEPSQQILFPPVRHPLPDPQTPLQFNPTYSAFCRICFPLLNDFVPVHYPVVGVALPSPSCVSL
ncbi:hypothetical protein P7K49_029706 [Saguinus oedipus]|uniref:Uncharacterized protein n=1 Tax=Saguinus oedipus TaxID=9490 RepID=A0ABQ9U7Z1_SAGOE|nr:hypothetical protein P7K49_029706 [Saguinus oedipus]